MFSSASLSLFFSQVLGKCKPCNGLHFPLCFFVPDTLFHFDPYFSSDTFPKVTVPLVFLNSFRWLTTLLAFLSVAFFFVRLCALVGLCLSLSLSFSLLSSERQKIRLTGHTPPLHALLVLFPFFRRCLFPFACPPVSAVRPSVSAFFPGCVSRPRAFLGFPELGA